MNHVERWPKNVRASGRALFADHNVGCPNQGAPAFTPGVPGIDRKVRLSQRPGPAKKGKARKSPFRGIYFWEFGDDHYRIFTRKDSLEKVIYPTYRPAKASALSKICLTPFYSPDPPKSAEKATNAGGKGPATPMKYDLDRKLVMVETNTGGRVLLREQKAPQRLRDLFDQKQ